MRKSSGTISSTVKQIINNSTSKRIADRFDNRSCQTMVQKRVVFDSICGLRNEQPNTQQHSENRGVVKSTSYASDESVSSTRRATLRSNSFMRRSRIIRVVRNLPSLPAKGDLLTPNVIRTVGSSTAMGTIGCQRKSRRRGRERSKNKQSHNNELLYTHNPSISETPTFTLTLGFVGSNTVSPIPISESPATITMSPA